METSFGTMAQPYLTPGSTVNGLYHWCMGESRGLHAIVEETKNIDDLFRTDLLEKDYSSIYKIKAFYEVFRDLLTTFFLDLLYSENPIQSTFTIQEGAFWPLGGSD